MIKTIVINVGETEPKLIELTYSQAQILYNDLSVMFREEVEESAFDDPNSWQSILANLPDELQEMLKCGDPDCPSCYPESHANRYALTDEEIAAAVDEYVRDNALIDDSEHQKERKKRNNKH
jgi:hypothetical protein